MQGKAGCGPQKHIIHSSYYYHDYVVFLSTEIRWPMPTACKFLPEISFYSFTRSENQTSIFVSFFCYINIPYHGKKRSWSKWCTPISVALGRLKQEESRPSGPHRKSSIIFDTLTHDQKSTYQIQNKEITIWILNSECNFLRKGQFRY